LVDPKSIPGAAFKSRAFSFCSQAAALVWKFRRLFLRFFPKNQPQTAIFLGTKLA
jgi:hypothetical protein